jgi:hypothetical protein
MSIPKNGSVLLRYTRHGGKMQWLLRVDDYAWWFITSLKEIWDTHVGR